MHRIISNKMGKWPVGVHGQVRCDSVSGGWIDLIRTKSLVPCDRISLLLWW